MDYFCDDLNFSNYFSNGSAIITNLFHSLDSVYFGDKCIGGWSIWYCLKASNDLVNEVDFEIFDLLFEIDIKNGADHSKIVHHLFYYGRIDAVKVRFRKIEL